MTEEKMGTGIISIGMAVPDQVLSNYDFERMIDTSDEWITTRTGIKERRIVLLLEKLEICGYIIQMAL